MWRRPAKLAGQLADSHQAGGAQVAPLLRLALIRFDPTRAQGRPDGELTVWQRYEAPSRRSGDLPRFECRVGRAVQMEARLEHQLQCAGLERDRIRDFRPEQGKGRCDVLGLGRQEY